MLSKNKNTLPKHSSVPQKRNLRKQLIFIRILPRAEQGSKFQSLERKLSCWKRNSALMLS